MYGNSIQLIEMPEHDSISVCVFCEQDALFALGERIGNRCKYVEMNGYNWDALIRFYVEREDPDLMREISTDPEAGMYSAYTSHSSENLDKMKRFESHVRALVANEESLASFVDANCEAIEWD